MIILIAGDMEDLTNCYVKWLGTQQGYDVIELDEKNLGGSWSFSYSDKTPSKGHLSLQDRDIAFSEIAGAFLRLNPKPKVTLPIKFDDEERYFYITERRAGLKNLFQNAPFKVVNRPYSGKSNASKPYQMEILRKNGFHIPRWIVTDNIQRILNFALSYQKGAIYKSVSGFRSRVSKVSSTFLNNMSDGLSPVLVQEYIEGDDVRIHTVNNKAFATKIVSETIDYRFDDHASKEYEAIDPPSHIIQTCMTVAKIEGLSLAGFDFKVTPDNKWYCLEVNPVPTFLPYEMSTGQQIGDTILSLFDN